MIAQVGLIFDIGVSEGNDSQFYLQKGFRVVGVEADEVCYRRLLARFEQQIAAGHLTILHRAAYEASGLELEFWRHGAMQGLSRLDPTDLSQFRDGLVSTRVTTINWPELVSSFGVPYYCKVDIEGAETSFLRSMAASADLPPFISVECHTFDPVEKLAEIGYNRFKFVNQTTLNLLKPRIPNPPLEGLYVRDPDWAHASGLFGRDLPDQWSDYEKAKEIFGMISKLKAFLAILGPCWFDCHACMLET